MQESSQGPAIDIVRWRYRVAGACVLALLGAQAFQELAYGFWIPPSHGAQDDLLAYLLTVDRARALLVGGTILLMMVPNVVIALRYIRIAPLASTLGLIFESAFVGIEIVHRSIDFFVVGAKWAPEFQSAAGLGRDVLLQRFELWNQMVIGIYFPLLLVHLLGACAFFVATWSERKHGAWYWLAPIAFALNALRLVGRLLSMFGGQTWLDGFNGKLYFPAVLLINVLLALWFFHLAREANDGRSEGSNSRSLSSL